jgi:hypothetical protein
VLKRRVLGARDIDESQGASPPSVVPGVGEKKEHTVQDMVSHGVSEEQRKLRAVGAAWLFAVQDVVVSRSKTVVIRASV